MNVRDKLRNKLVRKIQSLSTKKLAEVEKLLGESVRVKSKEETLRMAGSWKNMGGDFFSNLTTNLHTNRALDRQID
jgi:hypothetical protein